MHSQPTATSRAQRVRRATESRYAAVKVSVLVALCAWALWPEVRHVLNHAWRRSDWGHTLASPVVLLALLYCRRHRLAESVSKGSVWGVVAIVGGLAYYALFSRWPLNFGYAGSTAIIPVLGGIVLAVCGWRVLKHSLPLLLLVFLSIPLEHRMYASLIIRPETHTLSATRTALDWLPGVDVSLDGPDLTYVYGRRSGAIALGEPHRGALLFFAYATVGVFVVFARIRPFWQVAILGLAAVPIVLLCNMLRLFMWGVVTIYGGASPTSAMPRAVAVVVSLLAAYVAFALLGAVLSALVARPDKEDEAETEADAPSSDLVLRDR